MSEHLGRHWLLLRGLSRESAHWGDFPSLLRMRLPHAEIATLDLPGTGAHYRELSPSTLTDITDSLRAQAAREGLLKQPLTLLGLSLGGMVAWDWASRYPHDVCGVVLINSSFANLSPFYRRLRWQSYANVFNVLGQRDVCQRERAILQWVINRRDLDEAVAQAWAQIQSRHPVSMRTTVNQLVAAARYIADQKPSSPVLLLNSAGDRLVDPACSQAISEHWQLPLMTHPWSGHDLPLDDGNWVAERLLSWVKLECGAI